MPRESPYPLISPAEALQTILEAATPVGTEHVSLLESHGRILAVDVEADADLPGLPRSSVDGYAVISSDESESRRVLEEVTAGRLAVAQVEPGTAVHIMTGGTLPAGADAVVMVEDADEENGLVGLHKLPRPGENVHPPGMDLARGQRILSAGTRIGIPEVGLLAAVGRTLVEVYRRPKVAVLATGDEVVEPDEIPPPGAVRDSNRYALVAAVREAGCEVVWHGHAPDDPDVLERRVSEGLERADVLLTSGGVSMGTRDLIKPLLERLTTVRFGRISFKPGKPLTFGVQGRKLAFGLPGFPVSSLVTFEVFVRPALLKLAGRAQVFRPRIEARLEHELRRDPARVEYARAIVRWQEGGFLARTTGLQASSRLLSIAGANALLEIEPGEGALAPGSNVKALLLADL